MRRSSERYACRWAADPGPYSSGRLGQDAAASGNGTPAIDAVEHAGSFLRLWADSADERPIEIPAVELLGMLQTVHTELSGFLALVELWADRYVPALAPALVGKLAEDLDIGAPLG
ncbi:MULTISPECIES: hypothetical protein [unclassified Streptomyces]|uniref:hypothetical protein n=1 Tax=unclassified Streptomyces TaxID=2593676 RepID=UPI00380EB430